MSRISQQLVLERENFVRQLFRSNPDLSGIEAQAMLTKQYGQMMRPNRLYELKKEVERKVARTRVEVAPQPQAKKPVSFRTLNADILNMQAGRLGGLEGQTGEIMMIPVLVIKR